jgi:uncharacterized protein with GYD domain
LQSIATFAYGFVNGFTTGVPYACPRGSVLGRTVPVKPGIRRPLEIRREEATGMPFYLATFSYTPEAWSQLINKPEDRREVVRALAEGIGGKLHGFWYAFGDYDGLVLFEAPNNAAAGAVAARALSGGALKSYATTVLFTVEEAVEMLKQAQHLTYQPPGG